VFTKDWENRDVGAPIQPICSEMIFISYIYGTRGIKPSDISLSVLLCARGLSVRFRKLA
jgi:hypothetical protein